MTVTGQIGEVMQESTKAALTWVRSYAIELGLDTDFYKNHDIHVHVPAGSIPKDGPSAGVTMVTALVSALTSTPIKPNLAMTGEITLSGHVLPIGGIKEKILAAKRSHIREVIVPAQNEKNVREDIQPEMLQDIEIHYVRTIEEVLNLAFPQRVFRVLPEPVQKAI
jgi:ATP-dependent Lon protease